MKAIISLAVAAAIGAPGLASAQSAPPISLTTGTITTTQSCTYFRNSAGHAAAVVTPWTYAAAAEWRTWWVKDCVRNFQTMRSTLESALAAAPSARVGGAGRFRVSLNITSVSNPNAGAPTAPGGGDFAIAQNFMVVSFNVTVHNAAGRAVFGQDMTKRIELGSDIRTQDFRTTSSTGGEAAYGIMQNEIAMAAARTVVFHFRPIEVTGGDGQDVQLNYGTPYLKLGDLVMVSPFDGSKPVRLRVTAAIDDSATAEVDGEGDASRIGPRSRGTYIEAEDPQQNARRYRRVDLPQ